MDLDLEEVLARAGRRRDPMDGAAQPLAREGGHGDVDRRSLDHPGDLVAGHADLEAKQRGIDQLEDRGARRHDLAQLGMGLGDDTGERRLDEPAAHALPSGIALGLPQGDGDLCGLGGLLAGGILLAQARGAGQLGARLAQARLRLPDLRLLEARIEGGELVPLRDRSALGGEMHEPARDLEGEHPLLARFEQPHLRRQGQLEGLGGDPPGGDQHALECACSRWPRQGEEQRHEEPQTHGRASFLAK